MPLFLRVSALKMDFTSISTGLSFISFNRAGAFSSRKLWWATARITAEAGFNLSKGVRVMPYSCAASAGSAAQHGYGAVQYAMAGQDYLGDIAYGFGFVG